MRRAGINNWQLRGESDFNFAAGTMLASGDRLVVVTFDPVTDATRFAGFVEHEGLVGSNATIVGGLDSNFNNGFGQVELQQPDKGAPLAHVTADEILYDDLAPWPTATVDGGGASLHRLSPNRFGNDATSWQSHIPSPGTVNFTTTDFDGDNDIDGIDFLAWQLGFGTIFFATELTAWEKPYGGTASATHLSFDNDTDVDGADLLTWQRGFATTYSADDLQTWNSNYGVQSGLQNNLPNEHGLAIRPVSTDRASPAPNEDAQLIDAAMAIAVTVSHEVESTSNVDNQIFPARTEIESLEARSTSLESHSNYPIT